jgi:hypothetical protein
VIRRKIGRLSVMNSNEDSDSGIDSALSSKGIEGHTSTVENQASTEKLAPTEKPNAAPWIGLDIGGANLKAAHSSGWSNSMPFPMWKQPETLAAGIAQLLEEAPAFIGVGVTMTGELADCFATRSEGVLRILEQTTLILPASMVRVYGVDGQWRTPSAAARVPWTVAASNWHALARVVGATYPTGMSLLVDIGSTTTDLIPIVDGEHCDRGSHRFTTPAMRSVGLHRHRTVQCRCHRTACPFVRKSMPRDERVFCSFARCACLVRGHARGPFGLRYLRRAARHSLRCQAPYCTCCWRGRIHASRRRYRCNRKLHSEGAG